MVGSADLLGYFLYVLICGLRFLGENYVNIVVFLYFPGISLDLVAVKYQNDPAFFISLVVAEDVLETETGGIQIGFCQAFQLRPCKYNVVSVH